jgi:hypothetical protein
MITINNKYDISLSDADTVLYGRPRIIDTVSESSVKDKFYKLIIKDILEKLATKPNLLFSAFWNKYYHGFDMFSNDDTYELSKIYTHSHSIIDFFRSGDKYLSNMGKKKMIFLPLRSIFKDFDIFTFVGRMWILDIKSSFENVQVMVEKIQHDGQIGGSTKINTFDVQIPKTSLHIVKEGGGDIFFLNDNFYFLDGYRKYV